MSLCSKCNFLIDDDDFCLKYTRNSPVEAEIIKKVLTTGKCAEYKSMNNNPLTTDKGK